MESELVVGIDLGTTNSCISVKRNGRIDVIPNSEGNRTTLSFVYYGRDNKVLVGQTAKHEAFSKPSNGIYEIKRLIGCLHDDADIELEKESLTYKIVRDPNGEIKIEVNDASEKKCYKCPEEVCARILHKLKVDAENHLNQKITKAVITVPAYFNNNQRAATRDAARIAGLEVLKLINEPSAAALAYIHDNNITKDRIILIFDLGGGTFDVSIVKTQNGNVRVLSVAGDTHLGGQDFLNRLVHHVTEEIESKYKIQVKNNQRYMWNINNSCETAKKILTSSESTTVFPDFFSSGNYDGLEITRSKFEEINENLFKKTIEIVGECMKNGKLNKGDIDEVLLVGGSSRIPKIENLLREYFDNKLIQRNINADEAIAVGAAIEAHRTLDTSRDQNTLLVDVLPLSIGTVFDENTIFFNFRRNTALPANCKHVFEIKKISNKGRRRSCILSVYEGEHSDCSKNVLLGAETIELINSMSPNRNIEITMQINEHGIIWVRARGNTIKTFNITLNRGKLEEEEIKRLSREIMNKH